MKLNLTIVLLSLSINLFGQFEISGTIRNAQGEPLVSASIFLRESPYAAVSDEEGKYSISGIEEGSYLLKASFLGYSAYEDTLLVDRNIKLDIQLSGSKYALDDIEITANSLDEGSPFSYTELEEEQINRKNLAQDLPVLLEHQASLVVTSDAGAGVGYTSMRIRGSDATRINVTVNGVPLNDSESHGVFWVNMPDFASSVNDIQIQRGVGPSTNGAAAFGATVGLNTGAINENPLISFDGSYGSFNTQRLAVAATTGLINQKFSIEGRYSVIKSDGFVDRATSDLKSYYFSASYLSDKGSLRFNTFSGSERTYQSWWGVPEARLEGDQEALLTHYNNNVGVTYLTEADSVNLFDSGRSYNYYLYDNQVDDYNQDHYQLIWNRSVSDNYHINATMHYTRGLGFFEEYRVAEEIADYGFEGIVDGDGDPIEQSDLVRRRWLDNHFYGLILNNRISLGEASELVLGVSDPRGGI